MNGPLFWKRSKEVTIRAKFKSAMSADNTQQATAYTNVVNQDSLTSNINTCIFHKEGIIVNILRVI